MPSNRKRSSDHEMGPCLGRHQGVGGRQQGEGAPGTGGGYQDIYNQSNAPLGALKKSRGGPEIDPRISELREMGLSHRWIEVAEAIGVEAFLRMWSILDRDNLRSPSERECIRVWIPQMRRYFRYQRNKLIQSLTCDQVPKIEIQRIIKAELGEHISIRHIDRIASRGRSQPLRQK